MRVCAAAQTAIDRRGTLRRQDDLGPAVGIGHRGSGERDRLAAETEMIGSLPITQRDLEVKLRYVIASSPRTGSYLLCELLAATGVAGKPTEPFNPRFRHEFCRMWALRPDVTFEEYLPAVIRNGTSVNGVFGVKLHWGEVELLVQEMGFNCDAAGTVLDRLFAAQKYVRLIRRDRRAQAISLYRAAASNEWWRIAGVRNHQITGPDPDFDSKAIRRLESELNRQQAAWERHFRSRGVEALVVEYEALAQSPRDEVARVLSFIGQDPAIAAQVPGPRLAQQADARTEAWRQRLNAEDARMSSRQ